MLLASFIFGQLYESFYSPPHLPYFFVVVFVGMILLLLLYTFFLFSLEKRFDTFNWYLMVSIKSRRKRILNPKYSIKIVSSSKSHIYIYPAGLCFSSMSHRGNRGRARSNFGPFYQKNSYIRHCKEGTSPTINDSQHLVKKR